MNNLPQRRKSAEEIAKLRESMGVPGAVPAEPPQSVAPTQVISPFVSPPAAQVSGPQSASPSAAMATPELPVEPKMVKSLRRSERVPIVPRQPVPVANSFLPARRHSNDEIRRLDESQAAPPDKAVTFLRSLQAHPLVIVALYACPVFEGIFGWGTPWLIDFDDAYFSAAWMSKLSNLPWLDTAGKALTIACILVGLALSLWITLKKRRSVHHAGFATLTIIVITCFIFLT